MIRQLKEMFLFLKSRYFFMFAKKTADGVEKLLGRQKQIAYFKLVVLHSELEV
jgi:hypothetical protein